MPRIPPISLRLSRADAINSSSVARPLRYNHPTYASDPLTWTRRFLKFFPDPIQAEVLQATDPRLLLNCTRQWGKSTIIAAKALHFAIFHPKTTTLIAAPSERQSLILLRRLQAFIKTLRIKTAPVPGIPFSILLPNGSEIIALPAKADTTRGFTAHLLILDEAARIPDPIIHALSPTRATTDGPFWVLSTPNGPTGFFYEAWHDDTNREQREPASDLSQKSFNRERRESGSDASDPSVAPVNRDQTEPASDPNWRRFQVPASDCPRIPEPYLRTERLILGDVLFRQEYHCEFIAGPHTMFSLELLEAAIDPTLLPLFPGPLWN